MTAGPATFTIVNARLVTPVGPGPHRGSAMGVLRYERADVVVRGSLVIAVEPAGGVDHGDVLDAGGRVLMPAFVDCHTHACWCGERLDEWERKLAGATYMEILAAGGGIMSTVRAVRNASDAELAELLVGDFTVGIHQLEQAGQQLLDATDVASSDACLGR